MISLLGTIFKSFERPIGIDQKYSYKQQIEVKFSINFFTLLQQVTGDSLISSCPSVQTDSKAFTTYFLRGNDERLLSSKQAQEIESFLISNKPQVSCYVYNSTESMRKLENWNTTFPWIKAHYAIKSNPTLPLLKDLLVKGTGFDCASRTELQTVLSIGADKNSIVYSNPVKDESDLAWAEQNGIKLTTADTIDELIKIQEFAPKMNILWRISIKENDSDKQLTAFSGKFGDDIDTPEKINERMEEIQKMGIKLKGIHFHCGSGMHGSSAFKRAVLLARECLKIGRDYGHEMSIMDVGGGFPSGDLNESTIEALKITENDPLGYRVMAEPGRHFCAKSFYLLTRVLGKRVKNGRTCYHLNESLYHSFNCNLMDSVSFENSSDQFYRALSKGGVVNCSETHDATLFGMTCDGVDIITRNLAVPASMKMGDWLCVSGMGAYTYGSKSNFNGMRCTETVFRWQSEFKKSENLADTSSSEELSEASE